MSIAAAAAAAAAEVTNRFKSSFRKTWSALRYGLWLDRRPPWLRGMLDAQRN
jgi:hypothetical protein